MQSAPDSAALMTERKRLVHIELLRALAIYLVIFNHTGPFGVNLYADTSGSPWHLLHLFVSILDSVGVPLFFMISGALLLGREESLKELYRKRVLKFCVVLFVVSMCYGAYDAYVKQIPFAFIFYIQQMFAHSAAEPLWFLYSYIGMLIMLPILRRAAAAMVGRDYVYLAAANIVLLGVLPILLYLWGRGRLLLNDELSAYIVTATNIFYVFMGYYLEHVLEERYYTGRLALIAAAASVAAILVCCFMMDYAGRVTADGDALFLDFHHCLTAVPAMTIYYCARLFSMRRGTKPAAAKVICFFGGTAFGVYLLEGFTRRVTFPIYERLSPALSPLPASLLWILAACLLGTLLTALLKRIPVIKKYL